MKKVKISILRSDPKEKFCTEGNNGDILHRFFEYNFLNVLSNYSGRIQVYISHYEKQKQRIE